MTYAEKLAFETANEIFALDLICKRIDEFESRLVESTIKAAITKAMQAQREACEKAYQKNKMFSDCAHEILNAEVEP